MNFLYEFTESSYKELLRFVRDSGYTFIPFTRARECSSPHVLLRHDIDMSPQRAAKISQIESEEDILSTYFLHLHSCFYNLFEEDVTIKIFDIIDNGHAIGLHYDIHFYKKNFPLADPFNMIDTESNFIRDVFSIKPSAISFHNPALLPMNDILLFYTICGLVNAHSSFIRKNYVYTSDSNGVWNHTPINDAISEKRPRLHILTHPEWWTDVPMSRADKVERCIVGRCENQRRLYNLLMEDVYGKTN